MSTGLTPRSSYCLGTCHDEPLSPCFGELVLAMALILEAQEITSYLLRQASGPSWDPCSQAEPRFQNLS